MNGLLGFGALVCALWLPGFLVAKRYDARAPILAGCILSPLFTYLLIFGAELCGVPLTRIVVLGGLFGLTGCVWWACRNGDAKEGTAGAGQPLVSGGRLLKILGGGLFGIATILLAVRAIRRPLTGWDTTYRWTWLAERMAEKGTFGFYPPVSDADFMTYVYCDGIPPITQFIQFICFVGFGGADPLFTAPVVIFQYCLLGYVISLLARDFAGDVGASLGLAVAALCPLLLWAVVIGQETGWTALAIASMVYYLRELKPGDLGAALVGGAAAALAALAREYGCAFVILAAVWGLCRKADRNQMFALLGCGFIAFSWYLRNWILTGNPVFSNNIAGIFPGNPVHDAIMVAYGTYLSPLKNGWVLQESVVHLARGAAVAVVLGAAGLWAFRKKGVGLLGISVLLIAALWFYSIGKTAGGPRYALRVLSPAVALLAAIGGAWLVRAPKPWLVGGVLVVWLGMLPSLISAPFYVNAWSPKRWFQAADAPSNWHPPEAARIVGAISMRPSRILTDVPNAARWFHGTDVSLVPVYSPGVRFLFEPNSEMAPEEARKKLQEMGIYYVLKTNGGLNDAYLMKQVPFFSADSANWELIHEDPTMLLYRLPGGTRGKSVSHRQDAWVPASCCWWGL